MLSGSKVSFSTKSQQEVHQVTQKAVDELFGDLKEHEEELLLHANTRQGLPTPVAELSGLIAGAYAILVNLPVGSCTCECLFSALRHLKV